MKVKLIGEPKVVQDNPNSRHNYFGWPSVAKLQDGKIAVVSSGYRLEHVCPFGKAVISYSFDGGESYTRPAAVIDTPLDDRDAGILPFGEKGVVFTSFNNLVKFQRKCANGETYRAAYLDTVSKEDEQKYIGSLFCISKDCGTSFSEIYKSPVTSPHGPTELSDGSLLWVGNAFEYPGEPFEDEVRAYKINLDGTTELVGKICDSYQNDGKVLFCEPHAIEAADGTIICHIRVQSDAEKLFTIYQSESSDKGKTWTQPHRIIGESDGAPAHLFLHSSGTLISVYGRRKSPYGVRVMFSTDNGKTWDSEHIIYTDGTDWDIGYPATAELDDKSLLTVFYAHPEKGQPAVIMQQKWELEP